MIPGMNPREMQKAMKRLGIKQEEIDASQVIIKTADSELIINNPQVSRVNMMGQETYQIMGSAEEKPISAEFEISSEDIQLVISQTGCSEDEAKNTLKNNDNDIAKAILALKK
jgi:nascent polypeptide-associated complex subunit alpha